MKKSFSLIEVIISIILLSVVMISLLQIKSDNIFLLNKNDKNSKLYDYIYLAMNTKNEIDKNDNIHLDNIINFNNNDLIKEFKNIKIKVKSQKISTQVIKNNIRDLNIITYSTSHNIKDDLKKNIYTFKIEL